MTKREEHLKLSKLAKLSLGRIVANTRPSKADIYLDGEVVMDISGEIAKTPTIIYDVYEGIHDVTFSRIGCNDITVTVNVQKGSYCHARALLNTSMFSYPSMLSDSNGSQQSLQPSPGWPYLPIRQVTYGHMVTSTIPDGAETYLDGQPVLDINGKIATTPSSVTGIITGIHIVTFKKAGYIDTSITIEIQNGLYSDARAILQPI